MAAKITSRFAVFFYLSFPLTYSVPLLFIFFLASLSLFIIYNYLYFYISFFGILFHFTVSVSISYLCVEILTTACLLGFLLIFYFFAVYAIVISQLVSLWGDLSEFFVHLFDFLIILLQRKPNDVAAVGFIWNNFLPKENQRSGREKERERERERERNKITLQIEIEMDSFALWKTLSNQKIIIWNSLKKVSILSLVCRALRHYLITFYKHLKKFRSTYWMLGEHYLSDIYPIVRLLIVSSLIVIQRIYDSLIWVLTKF